MHKVLKSFDYARDGVNVERLKKGAEVEIRSELVEGLVSEGLIGPASGADTLPDGDGDETLSGGTPSSTGRAIRHAGRGMYHVVAADGAYVTPVPIPKVEAEALAAQG